MHPAKTNALRLLDEAEVEYRVLAYDLTEESFSAEAVASQLGLPLDQVFKTLVAIGEDGPTFAVVPGGSALDLKALATVRGERKMAMAPLAEVRALTGYERGAVTVLGAKREFPVVIDEIAVVHDEIAVSAGARGLQVLVATGAYLRLTRALSADIGR